MGVHRRRRLVLGVRQRNDYCSRRKRWSCRLPRADALTVNDKDAVRLEDGLIKAIVHVKTAKPASDIAT